MESPSATEVVAVPESVASVCRYVQGGVFPLDEAFGEIEIFTAEFQGLVHRRGSDDE